MINIPLNKALVLVKVEHSGCAGCCFVPDCRGGVTDILPCYILTNDGKNVIFRLVDWPGEDREYVRIKHNL